MKYFTILGLFGICVISGLAVATPANKPSAMGAATAPVDNLYRDVKELRKMVVSKPIRRLVSRYLLNDPEFQTFVRIINSQDAYLTRQSFLSQPEVVSFMTWFRMQIALSGGKFSSEESDEMINIINRSPYWANNVFGWQGFVNEFMMYYPQDLIQAHIQMKVSQNGMFAQVIQRMRALQPVYDRVIAFPEAQRVAAALQANGIDVAALDNFIRNQFGWQKPVGAAVPGAFAAHAAFAPAAHSAYVPAAPPAYVG